MSERGVASDELGRLAESTFGEILRIWFGLDVIITRDDPDRAGIDCRMTVSVSGRPSDSVTLNWQIKARTIAPRESKLYGEPAYVVDLSPSGRRSLMVGLSHADPMFLALAIPNFPLLQDLIAAPPVQRFTWFSVDLDQFIRRLGIGRAEFMKSVHVPARNRLNLAGMSLLWGSCWFSKQVALLNQTIIQADPFLLRLAQTFLWGGGSISALDNENLADLAEQYRRALADTDLIDRPQLNFLYGTAMAQTGIASKIAEHGEIDSYFVYAVEALGNGINLWLFSRQVRRFLAHTDLACVGDYVRLFPVRDGNLRGLPLYLRCALSHVYQVHSSRGVELNFVEPVVEREPTDHVHVDGLGGIRTFVIDQGESWRIAFDTRMAEEEGLLQELARSTILERGLPDSELRLELGLAGDDVRLGEHPPIDFLASTDRFLEYPLELWL